MMDDFGWGETFGDGGIPCRDCKDYVDKHELSDAQDARGHRKWVCPSFPEDRRACVTDASIIHEGNQIGYCADCLSYYQGMEDQRR